MLAHEIVAELARATFTAGLLRVLERGVRCARRLEWYWRLVALVSDGCAGGVARPPNLPSSDISETYPLYCALITA